MARRTLRQAAATLLAVACLNLTATCAAQGLFKAGTAVAVEDESEKRNRVLISEKAPPKDLAAGAEVVLITGIELAQSAQGGVRARVTINRPGKNVLLVLSSQARVVWEVVPTRGTSIVGVLLSSSEPAGLQMVEPASAYAVRLGQALEPGKSDFIALQEQLFKLAGVTRINVFRGQKVLPRSLDIGQPDALRAELAYAPPARVASGKPGFDLYSKDYDAVRWTFDGPVEDTKANYQSKGKFAVAPSGNTIYRLEGNALAVIEKRTGARKLAPLPANFPEFSWAMDVAYDTKRHLVTVISLGGEGYLYRFNATTGKWHDYRSVNNVDVNSLGYDAQGDRYLAWTTGGDLLVISGEGVPLSIAPMASRLSSFARTAGEAPGHEHTVTLAGAGAGDDVAIVVFANDKVKAIWQYNLKTQSSRLAYKGP